MRRFRGRRYKESREANKTKYYARAVKRLIRLCLWAFLLFVVVMAIIWAAPRVWNWALG